MENKYDLIVIGAGPAGLTAALYASRYKINLLVLGDPFVSTVCGAHLLENWPGTDKITGLELIQKFSNQVKSHGVEILNENVEKIEKKDLFKVKTKEEKEFLAKTIIIATGAERKKLDIPGEKELLGKGVSYCATCDAPFLKNKEAAVIGNGNAAVMAADLLSQYASKVYLVVRSQDLLGEAIWQERIKDNPKIEIIYKTNVLEIKGQDRVESIILDQAYKNQKEIKVQGVIIEIGSKPISGWLKEVGVETDEKGYIKITSDGSTSLKGVFAAGDITNGSNNFRQVITAAAEGAIAALGVYNYLKGK
jgi:thioredoxin reductase (NADPH)